MSVFRKRQSHTKVGESKITCKFYSITFNWVQLYCIHCVFFASLCVRVAWIPWPKSEHALVANTPECCKQIDVKGRESGWRGQSSSSLVLGNSFSVLHGLCLAQQARWMFRVPQYSGAMHQDAKYWIAFSEPKSKSRLNVLLSALYYINKYSPLFQGIEGESAHSQH